MPGTEIFIATAMPKAPGLLACGPMPTSLVIETSAGRATLLRAETAFIAPMKQAE